MSLVKKSIFLEKINFSLFKNKSINYIYLYSENYYCLIKLNNKIILNINSNKFIKFTLLDNNVSIIKKIESFILQFIITEYIKIKFSGKGYKIKKNTNNSIVLLFNRAHTTTLWWKNASIKKLKKYKIYLNCTKENLNIVNVIIKVRKLNVFTKKGLRLARQTVLKKKGKK